MTASRFGGVIGRVRRRRGAGPEELDVAEKSVGLPAVSSTAWIVFYGPPLYFFKASRWQVLHTHILDASDGMLLR